MAARELPLNAGGELPVVRVGVDDLVVEDGNELVRIRLGDPFAVRLEVFQGRAELRFIDRPVFSVWSRCHDRSRYGSVYPAGTRRPFAGPREGMLAKQEALHGRAS